MAFSEKTKLLAKRKSAFRCCLCHKPFVEVHHIIPQAEGGADDLGNAASLCSSCHDLYGGNPEKRKTIRQMRDHWWELMEKRQKNLTASTSLDELSEIQTDLNWESTLRSKGIALYHVVFEDEDFEDSVHHIQNLVKNAQDECPNQKRFLFIDIDGHRDKSKPSGFDHDMYELQCHYLPCFLAPYLTEVYMPLGSIRNEKAQKNDVFDKIEVMKTLDQASINKAIDQGISSIWIADKNKMMKLE